MRYAELDMAGNTHFTGESGQGKTTALRGAFYFMTADSKQLGIEKGIQKRFVEYYFQNLNSHIVYEVFKEEGKYCIILTRTGEKIQYAFVDAPYRRDWIIDPVTNEAYNTWAEISKHIDSSIARHLVLSSKEYLDILWGCHKDKQFIRYRMSVCSDYENILKSLKGVFLNSSLDKEIIKDHIVSSVTEEDNYINLQSFRDSLYDFEKIKDDISLWYKKDKSGKIEVKELANTIKELLLKYETATLTRDKILSNLKYLVAKAETDIPVLEQEILSAKRKKKECAEKLNSMQEERENELSKLNQRLGAIREDIKRALLLEEKYKNITEELAELSFEEEYKSNLEGLNKQLVVLQQKNISIETKYENLLTNLKNTFDTVNCQLEGKLSEAKDNARQEKEKAFVLRHEGINTLDKKYADVIDSLDKEIDCVQNDVSIKQTEIAVVQNKSYYSDEIDAAKENIRRLEKDIDPKANEIVSLKKDINLLVEKFEANEKDILQEYDRKYNDYQQQKNDIQQQADEIEEKLSQVEGSFYSWLRENVEGWENNIGRVVDSELLYRRDLSPSLAEAGEGFYAASIELQNIDRRPITPEEYYKQKKSLLKKIEEIDASIRQFALEKDDRIKANRQKSTNAKREKETRISLLENEILSIRSKITSIEGAILDIEKKAKKEKEQDLKVLNENLASLLQKLGSKKREKSDLAIKKQEEFSIIENEYTSKIEKIDKDVLELSSSIKEEKTAISKKYENDRNDIVSQKIQELSGLGVDVAQIQRIEKEMAVATDKIKGLDSLKIKRSEYDKDKREYIERKQSFMTDEKLLTDRITSVKKEFNNSERSVSYEIEQFQKTINELEYIYNDTKMGLSTFLMRNYDIKDVEACVPSEVTSVTKLLDDMDDILRNITDYLKSLQDKTNSFRNKFNSNIFKFKEPLQSENDYVGFARKLRDFVDLKVYEDISAIQNQFYKEALRGIQLRMSNILQDYGKIRGVIRKINNGFSKNDLPGVIKKIAIDEEQSKDELSSVLFEIKEFVDVNDAILDGPSLFTTEEEFSEMKDKLIALLTKFVNILNKTSEDKIEKFSVKDMFNLLFTIHEGKNKCDREYNIPKIGSTGTKFMIRILFNTMMISIAMEKALNKNMECYIHCIIDEAEQIHPTNLRDVLRFANQKGIYLTLGSPQSIDPESFSRTYGFYHDEEDNTCVEVDYAND